MGFVSPDGALVAFARKHNLFVMNKANYEKDLVNPNDSTIVEKQLTQDGVPFYSHEAIRRGETDVQALFLLRVIINEIT